METWLQMAEFNGIDLSESYILGWSSDAGELRFELDAVLLPDHPEYSAPNPNEWACYRHATLIFPDVSAVRGLPSRNDVHPYTDASGEADYGCIDALESVDGQYRIQVDFGVVFVKSGSPRLELKR
jgi:hypothetical protein